MKKEESKARAAKRLEILEMAKTGFSLTFRQGFTDRQDIKLKSLGRYVYFAK